MDTPTYISSGMKSLNSSLFVALADVFCSMNLCVFLGPAIVVLLFAVSLLYLRLGMLIYRVRLISLLASFLGITWLSYFYVRTCIGDAARFLKRASLCRRYFCVCDPKPYRDTAERLSVQVQVYVEPWGGMGKSRNSEDSREMVHGKSFKVL